MSIWLLTSFSIFRTNLNSHLMHKNIANRFLKKKYHDLWTCDASVDLWWAHTSECDGTRRAYCALLFLECVGTFPYSDCLATYLQIALKCLVYLNSIQSTQKLLFIEISRFFVTLIRSHSFSNILMYAELSSQTMTTTRVNTMDVVICFRRCYVCMNHQMNVPTRAIMLRFFNGRCKWVREAQHVCLQANDRIIVSKNLLRIFLFRAQSFFL